MMSFPPKDTNTHTVFKWPWRRESPLSAQLLIDIPPEIELSDYQRLPGSISDSPSRLLHGESVKEEPIPDLDIFFERLYEYFCAKGLRCIVIKWIIEILNVLFMVCCIGFFFLYVDWNALGHLKCGVEALESGEKPCDLMEAIKRNPLVPFTFPKMITVGSMVILATYGLINFLKFFVQLRSTLNARDFYYNSLRVTDLEIQTISWPKIIEKVVLLQKSKKLCVVRDLSEHDIIMRIMRKENYLIGMVNKGIISFPIRPWLPGAGPTVKSHVHDRRNYVILPKALEWTLNWCIFQYMFDSNFCVRKDFLTSPAVLKKRLVFVGIAMLVLSPCLVIFPLVYLILRHAEELYNHPSTASSRRWSNLSRWIFREYNEVDHFFRHRMNNSAVHSLNYLKQFPTPLISIIAKFVSFVSGGLAGALIIMGFLGESILEGHIFGRNLFWYTIVFGTIAAISRKVVADELQVIDPEGAMCLVVQQTHYMPKRWRGKESSELVRREFETLFQYTVVMLVEEMASIFITPYLLIFELPKRVDDILRFITDFTIYVDGVGDVCSLSVFDFRRHGNRNYGSPFDAPKNLRSSQGKMEKSFLSFQSVYPSLVANVHGKQFLQNLQKFKERQIRQQAIAQYQAMEASGFVDSTGQRDDIFRQLLPSIIRNHADAIPPAAYNFGPLGLLDTDQRTHPYILDWYYMCHSPHTDRAEASLHFDEESPEFFQNTSPPGRETSEIEEAENNYSEVYGRAESHMGASTSSTLFRHAPTKHHGKEDSSAGNWWGQAPAYPHDPQQDSFVEPPEFEKHNMAALGSFLEPPEFGNRNMARDSRSSHHSGDISEGSEGDLEQGDNRSTSSSSWRNPQTLARTRYMDDSYMEEEDGLDLHFADKDEDRRPGGADAYDRAPAGLPVRIIPRSSDPLPVDWQK
ncbi:autophagy-related protein 9 [Lolium perenne]|uniref:autophagy-related protein 9 n=1 Tax=Lolium perenne TaxID=4522 RepID=UPI0021EA68E4|nr:autophagy-related protein 9-like [Lolium perenne]